MCVIFLRIHIWIYNNISTYSYGLIYFSQPTSIYFDSSVDMMLQVQVVPHTIHTSFMSFFSNKTQVTLISSNLLVVGISNFMMYILYFRGSKIRKLELRILLNTHSEDASRSLSVLDVYVSSILDYLISNSRT